MNSRITWPLFSRQTLFNSRITRPLMYLYQSCGPLNSRITWPLFSRQTSFISRITWPLIKILILLRTRALLGHFTLSQSPEISCISWPLYNNSYTPLNSRITRSTYLRSESGNLAYYLATLEKFLYSYEFAYYLATLFKTDFV